MSYRYVNNQDTTVKLFQPLFLEILIKRLLVAKTVRSAKLTILDVLGLISSREEFTDRLRLRFDNLVRNGSIQDFAMYETTSKSGAWLVDLAVKPYGGSFIWIPITKEEGQEMIID